MIVIKKFFLPLVAGTVLFFSCTRTNVFENNTTIPGYNWKNSFNVKGSFTVGDTTAGYNCYLILRHTDAYKYSNIWLNVGLQVPGDSMRYTRLNVELASDGAGWMGTGMDDIWEMRQLVFLPVKKAGTYNYSISQVMRDDPLPAVMSAGIRVEKR